ncbi:toxic anion resistance protein [Lachnoclostridium sp. An169]|uniref:toxic anion resistance protein n=1 Tax=Lachnoclostridium sp. An169 TaxID=1965569 RepID=UPI000B368129|nr:toxic anion resistance protein [Lachnoclostridium sp. An169]OUP84566.1 toxic anion resistance protein [Lachnoclostridium sp. An169]
MAEITLADLMQNSNMKTETEVSPAESAEALSVRLAALTPEERREAGALRETIDMRDSQMLMQYGSGAKQNIADFSANILNNIRSKDTGYIGSLMSDLVTNVETLDFKSLEKDSGILGVFQKMEKKVKRFLAQFEKLEVQVDRIEGKLEEARMELLKDIGMFDTMYEKNLDYFRKLQIYITAGEEKLAELKNTTIPALRAEAQKSGDPMSSQVVRDFEDTVAQFEKKIYDLKTSKTIAIQTAPQIRLIQNNDKLLADRIQTAIQETIPLWKSQMVMALGMYRQQKTLQLQRDITDTTNAMLLENSERLKQNTLEVARESERGIVDIETLKKANENLISTINEAVRIQEEGRARRTAAEQELLKIEDELKRSGFRAG